MTDSFPRQKARTRRFTLGAPRSFQISPDGGTVLPAVAGRHRPGHLPVGAGCRRPATERLIADPAELTGAGGEDDAGGAGPPGTGPGAGRRHRGLRHRRRGSPWPRSPGRAACTWLDLAPGGDGARRRPGAGQPARRPPTRGPTRRDGASPTSCRARCASPTWPPASDRVLAEPGRGPAITFGLAEFIAAEEMGRTRGYWWAPGRARRCWSRGSTRTRCSAGTSPTRPTRSASRAARSATRRPAPPTPSVTLSSSALDGQLHRGDLGHRGAALPGRGQLGRPGAGGRPAAGRAEPRPADAGAAGRRPRDRRDHGSCGPTPTRTGWTSCPACRPGPPTGGSPGPPTPRAPGGCWSPPRPSMRPARPSR